MTGPGRQPPAGATALLEAMRGRRVTREFLDEPVCTGDLEQVVRAARWASSAGNRRIHRFLVIRSAETIARLKPFAPGILASPPALIVVTTDLDRARAEHVQIDRDMNSWIDVGTALMSMMLACEALALGSCPATSFSRTAVARVLALPPSLLPELMLQIGYRALRPPRDRQVAVRPTAADLTDWEVVGQREPDTEDTGTSARS